MLLSVMLTTVVAAQPTPAHQVTRARLLEGDAPIVLADEPVTTRKELELREFELEHSRPSYGRGAAKLAGGTGLIALSAFSAVGVVEGYPLAIYLFALFGGASGVYVGLAVTALAAVGVIAELVLGVTLIVLGIIDLVHTHQQREDIDAQLADVRSQLKATPADAAPGKTLTVVRF